jgi:hypothetical protein
MPRRAGRQKSINREIARMDAKSGTAKNLNLISLPFKFRGFSRDFAVKKTGSAD